MSLIKFPKTPHIFVLPGLQIRGDKILSPVDARKFLHEEITIEEKIDGANVGFSIGEQGQLLIQNRGNYLTRGAQPQFDTIWDWTYPRLKDFLSLLGDRFIVFGEWCFAVHSIHYTALPDWFIGFDVYDKQYQLFLSAERRNAFFKDLEITPVPLLEKGRFTKGELTHLIEIGHSKVGGDKLEGLYLRVDFEDRLISRAKLVRRDFIQEIDLHWTKNKLQQNSLTKSR